MSDASASKVLLVVNADWCIYGDGHESKLKSKHVIALTARRSTSVKPASEVTLRFRDRTGAIALDDAARIYVNDDTGTAFLQSDRLSLDLLERGMTSAIIFVLLEQATEISRATIHFSTRAKIQEFSKLRPELRLEAHDLPPIGSTEFEPSFSRDGMDADCLYEVLLGEIQREDSELFAVHTETFLKAPHILVPLLNHLASLSAEDNLKFPIQLRRVSDQFRTILEMKDSPLAIRRIERGHLDAWAEVQHKRFAFVDGGVAKIAGLPGAEPTALRVGVYCVRPGDTSLKTREQWQLQPFVVGDIIDKNTGVHMDDYQQIDLRRLGEAARYTLESLVALQFTKTSRDVDTVYVHGPLINQFTMYDEGEPNFIPFLTEEFLGVANITKTEVEKALSDIPARDGRDRMWRQFMAIYGYIIQQIFASAIPFVGVVERSAGMWLAQAVLHGAVEAGLVKDAYRKKVVTLLKRYDISDDFLFGCVLAEGEYVTPTTIQKNEVRRARDRWQRVVSQYPNPFATVLKTTEFSFPFRVEMNQAAKTREQDVMRTLYHTARLLPRYAFPVGLDIVDKYAKVPDWLSKNISAQMAARVLNRTIAEGDTRLVTQVRRLLAHTPRDFFYRPRVDG